MMYLWSLLLLVSCALVTAEGGAEAPATTRAPPRTLDRQNNELAWRTWLQSPENGNPNAPPRRITTKSLFITPLVCPKGQRLDQNACVQVVTVNKDEHERILLEQLNSLFTSAPGGDIVYDYGDDEPLQLSIPIGSDPQAAPLQAQEPSLQVHDVLPNFNIDKKTEHKSDLDASLEAELELMKLQHAQLTANDTSNKDMLNHNVLNNIIFSPDKPKRDSPDINSTEILTTNQTPDEGQKELVYGHVNVDPVLYNTDYQEVNDKVVKENTTFLSTIPNPNVTLVKSDTIEMKTNKSINVSSNNMSHVADSSHILKKDSDATKLNPDHDYADIGEAIKLISRYAEVTTDDNFSKDQKKYVDKDDSILGTRTRLHNRRNKPKHDDIKEHLNKVPTEIIEDDAPILPVNAYSKNDVYYRYPWSSQHSPTPPPDYPFRHLQDYWPGRRQFGGVYNTGHENPRRHHHTYPHNYFKPHNLPVGYGSPYSAQERFMGASRGYAHRAFSHNASPIQSREKNQDLYSLLGLRHWFSGEVTSKR